MPLSCAYKKKQIQICLLKITNIESRSLLRPCILYFFYYKGVDTLKKKTKLGCNDLFQLEANCQYFKNPSNFPVLDLVPTSNSTYCMLSCFNNLTYQDILNIFKLSMAEYSYILLSEGKKKKKKACWSVIFFSFSKASSVCGSGTCPICYSKWCHYDVINTQHNLCFI